MQNKRIFEEKRYNCQNGLSALMIKQNVKPNLTTDVWLQNCSRGASSSFLLSYIHTQLLARTVKVKGRYRWHNEIWSPAEVKDLAVLCQMTSQCFAADVRPGWCHLPDNPALLFFFCQSHPRSILSSGDRLSPFKCMRRLFFHTLPCWCDGLFSILSIITFCVHNTMDAYVTR